ncbi:hypothetical protein HDV57DRAFT_43996 [Trichoderma longibrachiatum]
MTEKMDENERRRWTQPRNTRQKQPIRGKNSSRDGAARPNRLQSRHDGNDDEVLSMGWAFAIRCCEMPANIDFGPCGLRCLYCSWAVALVPVSWRRSCGRCLFVFVSIKQAAHSYSLAPCALLIGFYRQTDRQRSLSCTVPTFQYAERRGAASECTLDYEACLIDLPLAQCGWCRPKSHQTCALTRCHRTRQDAVASADVNCSPARSLALACPTQARTYVYSQQGGGGGQGRDGRRRSSLEG